MEEDPQILWRRIGAGDRRAFTTLYRRHQEDVLRFCHALLRDPEDAREAANSTWASVWRSRDAAERDIPLRPWLFRIAHNEAIDTLRRRRPHEPLDVGIAAPDDTAADAELHERLATLRDDLLRLTVNQRTALVLRELSGLGHDEIAAVLDVSVGAAKQTIYEARQALIDAEGGRSLSCELVRREVSVGDRRILRGRRISAHLRDCAACRELAEAVERQRRRFRVVVPAPAAALLSRLFPAAAEVAGNGAGSATAGLSALGTKVAAAAATIAVGGGVASGVGLPGSTSDAGAARGAQTRTAVAAAPPEATGHERLATPAAKNDGSTTAPPTSRPDPAENDASMSTPPSDTAMQEDGRTAPTTPPGQAKQDGAAWPAPATPPGQAKNDGEPTAAPSTPPGSAKNDGAAGPDTATPPGQAKKDGSSSTTPPGRAKQDDGPAAPSTPPGQAKKDGSSSATSPGHAEKGGGSAAPAMSRGQAKKDGSSSPTPPGHAKQDGGSAQPTTSSGRAKRGGFSSPTPRGQVEEGGGSAAPAAPPGRARKGGSLSTTSPGQAKQDGAQAPSGQARSDGGVGTAPAQQPPAPARPQQASAVAGGPSSRGHGGR